MAKTASTSLRCQYLSHDSTDSYLCHISSLLHYYSGNTQYAIRNTQYAIRVILVVAEMMTNVANTLELDKHPTGLHP